MIRVKNREDYLVEVKNLVLENSICVEIGCYKGEFSEKIIKTIDPGLLILIDPFDRNETRYKELDSTTAYSSVLDYKEVYDKFYGSSVVKIDINYSYNAVNEYENNVFDFIYHDASHLYEDIKMDLGLWIPKLNTNGLMCGHDYIDHPDFGVKQAVDEFCVEYSFEMIIFNENGGDYALRKCTQ